MHLVAATDAQKAERDVVTYAEWGKRLTPEAYADRERRLRAHPWSRADMRTWLLCAPGGQVLASCETFRTRSFQADAAGVPVAGDSFAIASVFTEEPLRGQGHATRLMDLLAAELAREPRAHTALLFSDVGPRIYARSGYLPLPAWDWHLTPSAAPPPDAAVHLISAAAPLTEGVSRLRPPARPFFYGPSAEQLDWHLERWRLYAGYLGLPAPTSRGATRGEDTVLWSVVVRSDTLVVLWLDARSPEAARALLGAARHEAHRLGLARVVMWDEPGHAALLAGLPDAQRVARPDALPMVRPLRPGLAVDPELPVPRGLWV